MEEKGQTVDLWGRARVMASVKGWTAYQQQTRSKDRRIRGRVTRQDQTRLWGRLCLLNTTQLNAGAGAQPEHSITGGAHNDTVRSITP